MKVPNTSYIEAIAGDDDEFKVRFINILKTEFPQEFNDYQTRFDKKDHEATARMVHKIKHKLNICGMQDAYYCAVRYEEELRNKSYDSHAEFITFLITVDEFIKSL